MKKTIMRHCGGALALAVLCTLSLTSARADQTVGANFNLPVHVNCHGRLIFRNNVKGTHTAEATSSVPLATAGVAVMSLFVGVPLGSMTLTVNEAPSQGRKINAPP